MLLLILISLYISNNNISLIYVLVILIRIIIVLACPPLGDLPKVKGGYFSIYNYIGMCYLVTLDNKGVALYP